MLAGVVEELRNPPVARREQGGLKLHALDGDERLAAYHLVAGLLVDVDDAPRHRRSHMIEAAALGFGLRTRIEDGGLEGAAADTDDLPVIGVGAREMHERARNLDGLTPIFERAGERHLVVAPFDLDGQMRPPADDLDLVVASVDAYFEAHRQFLQRPMSACGSGTPKATSRNSRKPSAAAISAASSVGVSGSPAARSAACSATKPV